LANAFELSIRLPLKDEGGVVSRIIARTDKDIVKSIAIYIDEHGLVCHMSLIIVIQQFLISDI